MDNFAGRKIDQLRMSIKRKNKAFTDREDRSGLFLQLECLEAGSLNHVVDSQPKRSQAQLTVILDIIFLVFGRSGHSETAIIEPAGRILLDQSRVRRRGKILALIQVARIHKGLRNIEGNHET